MKSLGAFLAALITYSLSLTALAQDPLWQHSFGGSSSEGIESVAIDGEGNTYAVGVRWQQQPTIQQDVILLKYNPDGNLLWARIWGTDYQDVATAVAVSDGGNVYVVGYITTTGVNSDGFILRWDESGTLLWSQKLGNQSPGAFNDIVVTGTDGIFVTGLWQAGSSGVFLARWAPEGGAVWAQTWTEAAAACGGSSLNADSFGHVIVAGWRDHPNETEWSDLLVQRYDNSGTVLWTRSFGHPLGWELLYPPLEGGIATVGDSAIVVVGHVYPDPDEFMGPEMGVILKLDTAGGMRWHRQWQAGPSLANARSDGVSQTGAGNIHVIGDDWTPAHVACIVAYDLAGDLVEVLTWSGASGFEGFRSIDGRSLKIVTGGWSASNSGTWDTIPGGSWIPNDRVLTSLTGTLSPVLDTAENIEGTVAEATGTIDIGGGGDDCLVVSLELPCECQCHADPACDGAIDVVDVVGVIDVAFRGGADTVDPECPEHGTSVAGRADVNCSNAVDVVDVVNVVNVAFRGGDPTMEFCDLCL